jgi:hypothetical protein
MLTAQDDLLGHQTPRPFAVAGGGDPRFTERYWYTGQPIDGTPLLLDIGFGHYPNRGVMDAFAGVTVGRRQHNFRASRRLGARPLDTTVGPLSLRIVEGHVLHRLALADNRSGIAFELDFEASFPAAQEKQSVRERKGVLEEDLARVAQFGRWHGWLQVGGRRHRIEPSTWFGQRDRSWGIRSEMKTDVARPPVQSHKDFFWTWSMFQTEKIAVSMFVKEREPGRPHFLSASEFVRQADGTVRHREATGFRHDIEWADDPLGQTMARARFSLDFADGPPRELALQALPLRFYLKGGLYGGFGGWNHGDDRGAYFEQADVWDLDDRTTRERARTLSDHVMRVSTGGEHGIGISEYGVAEGYARYPGPQRFPAL